jgi:hypothetical protein
MEQKFFYQPAQNLNVFVMAGIIDCSKIITTFAVKSLQK